MRSVLSFFMKRKLIPVALVMMGIAVSINSSFLNKFNLNSMLVDLSIIGLLTIGEMLVILTGGIDLSIGNIASASSVFVAFMMIRLQGVTTPMVNMILSILFAIIFCAALGALNGIGVVIFKMPPLIATLCGMWIAKGLGYYLLNGVATAYKVKDFTLIARGGISFIPFSFMFLLVIGSFMHYFLNHQRSGRAIYASGGNEYAASISGIKTKRVKIAVYIIAGVFGALAGLVLGSYTGTGYVKGANNYELYAIAASAIGGVALSGGIGDVWNSMLGVLILRILSKIMIFANLANQFEGIYIGTALIIAMIFSTYTRNELNKFINPFLKIFGKRHQSV
jgi:ribose/xylose/arabinose/galactoside ABC-type transport system permease subunit